MADVHCISSWIMEIIYISLHMFVCSHICSTVKKRKYTLWVVYRGWSLLSIIALFKRSWPSEGL